MFFSPAGERKRLVALIVCPRPSGKSVTPPPTTVSPLKAMRHPCGRSLVADDALWQAATPPGGSRLLFGKPTRHVAPSCKSMLASQAAASFAVPVAAPLPVTGRQTGNPVIGATCRHPTCGSKAHLQRASIFPDPRGREGEWVTQGHARRHLKGARTTEGLPTAVCSDCERGGARVHYGDLQAPDVQAGCDVVQRSTGLHSKRSVQQRQACHHRRSQNYRTAWLVVCHRWAAAAT